MLGIKPGPSRKATSALTISLNIIVLSLQPGIWQPGGGGSGLPPGHRGSLRLSYKAGEGSPVSHTPPECGKLTSGPGSKRKAGRREGGGPTS